MDTKIVPTGAAPLPSGAIAAAASALGTARHGGFSDGWDRLWAEAAVEAYLEQASVDPIPDEVLEAAATAVLTQHIDLDDRGVSEGLWNETVADVRAAATVMRPMMVTRDSQAATTLEQVRAWFDDVAEDGANARDYRRLARILSDVPADEVDDKEPGRE